MPEKPTYGELELRIQELEQVEFKCKRSEKALQESVKRYRNIFDNAQVGLYRSRLSDGKIVMANNRMAEILGYENTEECLAKYVAIEHYEYPELRSKMVEIIYDQGKVTNFEAPIRKDDGSILWLQFSGALSSEENFFEGVATDITASKLAEKELRYRNMIKSAVAKASSLFVSAGEVDYDTILQLMGESGFFNRAYIFQIQEDGCKMSNTFEWCAHGTDPQIDMLQDLDTSKFTWWMGQLRNGKNIVIRNVDELPPEAAAEKEILKIQQIRSLIIVPIWSKGQALWGFMGFDDTKKSREWNETEIEALQIVGEMISGDLERKSYEDKLAFERKQLLSIFDSIDEIIYVADPNSYEILYVNQSLQNAFQKELIGEICYRGFQGLDSPCDFCTNEIIFKQKPSPYRWEYHNPILNKEFAIVDRIIKWPDGRDVRFELAIDITELKHAQEALRESEEKYRTLFDMVSDALALIEIETGNMLDVNKTFIEVYGYSKEETIRMKNTDFSAEPEITKQATQARGTYIPIRYHKKKDGTVFPTEITASIFKYQGKDVHIAAIRDITERQCYEAQLQRSQKMESLGLLAGGVAHDLNNVLSGIVSYPDLLLLELPEDSTLRKPIQTMRESGHRAAAIVGDLLTIARGVATTKEPLNLNDLVYDYLNSPEFQKLKQFHPSVTINTNLDSGLLNILGSHIHIRKVVMNLVSNASEAIEGSGNITISTVNRYVDKPLKCYDEVAVNEYVVLSVEDDGSGIPAGEIERIFEPFYTKKVMGRSGTGLGLAVVWNVVQDHEGYINVKSDENGTKFELYFPITIDEISDKKLSRPMQSYKGNGETILVVDDVESQREIACKMLDTLGYKVMAVSSGEEAVDYLTKNTVDLALLDMIMDPGINGRETYERIKNIHPKQKAIIVSGFAETDAVKDAQKLGAGQYIKKPFTLEKIGMAIRNELKK